MKVIGFFVFMILLSSGVYAISGVNPRSYEIDFVPNYEGDLTLNFLIDGESEVGLSVEGALSDYVSLDKEKIFGSEKVIASFKFPSEIDSPGENRIKIIAGDVEALIRINVPYPEEYVELELSAPNIDSEDSNNIVLKAYNKGIKEVVVYTSVEIYSLGESGSRESVEILEADKTEIIFGGLETFEFTTNDSLYLPGDYVAVARVNYSESISEVENLFRIGNFSLRLVNYTKEFRENKVVRFEIEVESLSNKNINDVFVEVKIIGVDDAGFVVPDIGLKAWNSAKFVGFLDTSKIPDYDFDAEIILHYGEGVSSEIVNLKILKGPDYLLYIILAICMFLLIFLAKIQKKFIKIFRKYKK
jgi:hypothetical protein